MCWSLFQLFSPMWCRIDSCYALSGLSIAQWSNIPQGISYSDSSASTAMCISTSAATSCDTATKLGKTLDGIFDGLKVQASNRDGHFPPPKVYQSLCWCECTWTLILSTMYFYSTHSGFSSFQVYGDAGNLLRPTSAVYNVNMDRIHNAIKYFHAQCSISQTDSV